MMFEIGTFKSPKCFQIVVPASAKPGLSHSVSSLWQHLTADHSRQPIHSQSLLIHSQAPSARSHCQSVLLINLAATIMPCISLSLLTWYVSMCTPDESYNNELTSIQYYQTWIDHNTLPADSVTCYMESTDGSSKSSVLSFTALLVAASSGEAQLA